MLLKKPYRTDVKIVNVLTFCHILFDFWPKSSTNAVFVAGIALKSQFKYKKLLFYCFYYEKT